MSDDGEKFGGSGPGLRGCVLRSARIENGGNDIVIEMKDGRSLRYVAEGGCCSTSWIEHLELPDNIEGAVVLKCDEVGGNSKPGEDLSKYEVLQVYESRIHTDRGMIVAEYRNDSNGYYGGSLRFVGGATGP